MDQQRNAGKIYISIQYPIVDLRPLLQKPFLERPIWGSYNHRDEEFVHFFGRVCRRFQIPPKAVKRASQDKKDDSASLFNEDELYYASARRAVIFPHLEKQELGPLRAPQGGTRRLYKDKDHILSRIELGLLNKVHKDTFIDPDQLYHILDGFFNVPVATASCEADKRLRTIKANHKLGALGDSLANLYLCATSASLQEIDRNMASACDPLTMVQFDGDILKDLPEQLNSLDSTKLQDARVFYYLHKVRERNIHFTRKVFLLDVRSASPYTLRNIRLAFNRLHADLVSLAKVSEAVNAQTVKSSPILENFLSRRESLLSKDYYFTMDSSYVQTLLGEYGSIDMALEP